MDFGMPTFENTILDNDGKTPKTHGSGFLKHQRSDPVDPEPEPEPPFLRTYKAARPDPFDKTMPIRSDSLLSLPPCSAGSSNNMLSFSSSINNTPKNGNQSSLLSFYQPPLGNAVSGYGYGGMHVPLSRYKGPFTPSQWMELEHQALIYKHIVANVPVPSHLLNPIRKSLNPFLLSGTPSSFYPLNSYGWGTFHLGLSGNNDPEPGRCRRTDGKKWRCARDAVTDQKYCERHINRGRHRSRKPVEGHINGHKSNPPTTTPPKVAPVISSTSSGAVDNHIKKSHPHNATLANRSQDSQGFSANAIEESSDSLVYSKQKSPYVYQTNTQNPLHHFIDSWPKDQSDRTSIAWPEELKPDWTQLTMSIAPQEFDHDLDHDAARKQALNFVPISWENSMGGPLGEVLNRTCNSDGSSVSGMNRLFDIDGNDRVGSSPTGVLQKTTFVSLSNSSSGSSPRGSKQDGHGRSFCDEMLLSTLGGSTL